MNQLHSVHPLTNSGHILMGPIEQITPGMREFLNIKFDKVGPATVVEAGSSLGNALAYLRAAVDDPYPSRFLLLPARGRRTVLFNNAWRSHGLYSMALGLSKLLGVEDVFFLAQPNTIRKTEGRRSGQYGAFQLMRASNGELVRRIELINDGGRWSFSTRGEPEPFEKAAAYEAPKKQNRFTQAMMEEYLGEMGLFPFQEDFYSVDNKTPAVGMEIVATDPGERARQASKPLEEIQSFYGPFD